MNKRITLNKTVVNPNLWVDAKKYLSLAISKADLESRRSNWEEKKRLRFDALIDRLEFTDHLQIVSEYVAKKDFVLDGQEVIGLDNDIAALKVYLLLTCIDLCTGAEQKIGESYRQAIDSIESKTRKKFDDNIQLNCDQANHGLAHCFWKLRCGYTHSGFRLHYIQRSRFTQKHKTHGGYTLEIAEGFDFFSELKLLVAEIARKNFTLS